MKNGVAEAETVQAPVIVELVYLVEVLVEGFEDSESDAVHLTFVETHVGAIDEPRGIFFIEFGDEAGDGASLGVTGGDVSKEIGIAVEKLAQTGQIVVEIGEVAGDEGGVAVACESAVKNVDHA